MSKRIAMLVALAVSLLGLVAAAPAVAANFEPRPGTYEIDTTTLKLTGPGTEITGSDQGGVAVFSFDKVNVGRGVLIQAFGERPLKIVASGELILAGTIEASGSGPEIDFAEFPNEGGPGGGAGGTSDAEPGEGPGGGGVASDNLNGAGGGGFGGAGADGGIKEGNTGNGGKGGSTYGDLSSALQGGSGGGGASEGANAAGGGGGGGAVALIGATVRIAGSGEVNVDGGNGISGGNGASGGGSGGGILVRATVLDGAGRLSAAGGDGGAGGCCGDGGGGGGGRVLLQYGTLAGGFGAIDVSGGVSGLRSSSCCELGEGGASPQARGTDGVITKIAGPTVVTLGASAVTSTGATLNGTVNPNSSATAYRFEYGTTTFYGLRTPPADASVGADAVNHAVAAAITGLSPNVIYHYRLVATDALGFTTVGADVAFTTPFQCVVPKVKGKKLKAAKRAIKAAHCAVGKVKKVFSKKKKGRVVKQKPKAGTVGAEGTKINLKVSKGKKKHKS